MKNKSCCFTGHRQILPRDEANLKNELKNQIERMIQLGAEQFYCGGALGFDILAAVCVLEAKKLHPNISLVMALPCRGQDKYYNTYQRRLFNHIKDNADNIIYTHDGAYTVSCMHERNRYMVEHCAYCICYLRKQRGGTKYTADYARSHGVDIVFI